MVILPMSDLQSWQPVIARAPEAGVSPAVDRSQTFDMLDYFAGSVAGTGLFQDRFGRVRLAFDVTMTGRWDGDAYRLGEVFRYDDGRTDTREWLVRRDGDRGYTATADDIVGTAVGTAGMRDVQWRYRMRVPVGGRRITMSFDDRMYLRNNGVLLNVSEARKFGLLMGRLTAVFNRR